MHATGHVVNVGKKKSSELDCNSEDFVQLGVLLPSQSGSVQNRKKSGGSCGPIEHGVYEHQCLCLKNRCLTGPQLAVLKKPPSRVSKKSWI